MTVCCDPAEDWAPLKLLLLLLLWEELFREELLFWEELLWKELLLWEGLLLWEELLCLFVGAE